MYPWFSRAVLFNHRFVFCRRVQEHLRNLRIWDCFRQFPHTLSAIAFERGWVQLICPDRQDTQDTPNDAHTPPKRPLFTTQQASAVSLCRPLAALTCTRLTRGLETRSSGRCSEVYHGQGGRQFLERLLRDGDERIALCIAASPPKVALLCTFQQICSNCEWKNVQKHSLIH